MAEIVNDRDLLIMAAVPRFTPPTDRYMQLSPPAAIFRASGDGSTSTPPSFTFKATLLNMAGVVSFAASNGAQLTVNAAKNEATLDFAAYAAAGAEAVYITAAITVDGVPYTQQAIVTKVSDGAQGVDGAQTAVARLYQFSTTVPNKPTGNSTFTWAGAWNGAYTGTDGWGVTVPANPGTPGLRLYVASVSVSGAAKATTMSVSYTSATVEAWAQNGAKGDTGTSGVQSGAATVYQWAATIPSGPAGNALFRWASNSFGEAPSGWALAPGAAPALGMTLWAARVQLVDAATNGDTAFNWSTATIMAIGYAGTNGGPGQQGASYVTAYIASSAIAANGAPAQTTGRASLPAANSSGLAGAWSAAVPVLADGQRMYQSDGIYDPSTDKVTWSIPYWSSLKVATLSAITANLGTVNAGSMNLGNGTFTVDNAGNLVCYSIKIVDPNTGQTVFQAGGKFNPNFLPNEALNSQIVPSIQAAQAAATAAADLNLIARGACSVLGNTATKALGSGTGWNSDVYSKEGYAGGAAAKVTIPKATGYDMFFGLNSDPATDGSYTSLDYALHIPGGGTVEYWENGSLVASLGSMGDGDVLEIIYNGSTLRCLRNGQQMRSTALSTAAVLYFDSSFSTPGATMTNIRFAPMSDVSAGVAAQAGLADKLSKSAANILNAPITLQTAGAVATGTLTTDGAGNRTGGYGTLMSQYGLVHYTSDGLPAVTLGASGVAVRADISGSTGTFGAVRIGTSLALQATAYNSDSGIFFGIVNGVGKGSFVAGSSKILIDPSASQPIQLVNVGVAQAPLNVSISTTGGNLTTSYGRNVNAANTVVGYVNVADGSGNYTYSWSVTADGYACWTTNPAGSNCAGVMKGPGLALPDGVGFTLVCTVTDKTTNRSGQATFSPTIIFT